MEGGSRLKELSIEAGLYFDEIEIKRNSSTLKDFSLNGPTKLSPILWVEDSPDISFFIDIGISNRNLKACRSKIRVAVIMEPVQWAPGVARAAVALKNNFDAVLTFDDKLLALGKPLAPFVPGGVQLRPDAVVPTPHKEELVSMSASKKAVLPGHRLRHEVASIVGAESGLKLLGGGYQPYDSPNEPFSRFLYSIVIENSRARHYVTEKLLQCMLNKCVPIYWGGAIEQLGFDVKGVITFDSARDLLSIFETLTLEDYASKAEAIEENFRIAQNFISKEINMLSALSGAPYITAFKFPVQPQVEVELDKAIEPRRKVDTGLPNLSLFARVRQQWKYRFQYFWVGLSPNKDARKVWRGRK